jgi:hypothetical protein
MVVLLSILLITCAIFWLQKRIWNVEKNIAFPLFTGIFYYWSLAGTWLFTFDRLTHFGKSIGLNYYYLLEKMFYVHLDHFYLKSIWIYGVFILLFQLFCWVGLHKLKRPNNLVISQEVIQIKPGFFVFVAFSNFLLSLWIVKDVIIYSFILNESVYLNIRTAAIKNYTLHQYACWIMIASLFIYIGLYLRKQESRFTVQKPSFLFWALFVICNSYLILIGSRHETFFGGIVVLILMSYPFRSIRNSKKTYLLVLTSWLFILMLNDPIRSLMPVIAAKTGITSLLSTKNKVQEANIFFKDRSFTLHKSPEKSQIIIAQNAIQDTILELKNETVKLNKQEFLKQLEAHEEYLIVNDRKISIHNSRVSKVYQNNSVLTKITLTLSNMLFSNELFAGHFSMYGVLQKQVQPSYGLSFTNLYYSFIPSTVTKNRPLDAYGYYAQKMKFKGGQGFTINHVTAWYLNFSYLGILLGPFILSLFLLIPFYLLQSVNSNLKYLVSLLAICGITAFGAMMVRSGPESYKAMLYESILIPIFIVFFSVICTNLVAKFKSSNGK